MVDTRHCVSVKIHRAIQHNPNVNWTLVNKVSIYCFVSCNKCIALMQDVILGQCMGQGTVWELCISAQFFCKPKNS